MFVFLTPNYLFGQYQNIEFDHYTTNDGLSNGYINSILNDKTGFIWIGTANGLNCFDGLSFKTYFYDSKDSNSIPGNIINSLVEDSLGRIWISTNQGLCVYNKKTDLISRKQLKFENEQVENRNIFCSFIDSEGYLWLGGYNSFFRLKIYGNSQVNDRIIDVESYTINDEDVGEINRGYVNSFIEDNNGRIWVASYSNKLFYFAPNINRFIPYPINHKLASTFSNKQKSMLIDRDGDIFISIEFVGLLKWEQKKDSFTLYSPDGSEFGPNGNILYSMAEDENGSIWVGDRNTGGISILNKQTGKFTNLLSSESNYYSLISNKISLIYRDNKGIMWVGANIGLDKYSPDKTKFNRYYSIANNPNMLSYNNTLCFVEGKNNVIWVGTDGGGLNKLDREKGIFTQYKNNPSNVNSISSNAIISACEDHEGTLWIGTFNGGLGKLKDNKFSAYYHDPSNSHSIAQNHVWDVLEDSKNNLWVATLSRGLDLFDRKSNKFFHYTHNENDSTSISNYSLIKLFEDSRQMLYVSSYHGVSVVDLNEIDFSKTSPEIKFRNLMHNSNNNSISSNGVSWITEDIENNIWFGTLGTGMDKLNPSTGEFTNYSTKDGLPGNVVSSILFDDENNIWAATDKGLAKLNPNTNEVQVFNRQDGLQNTNFKGKALKTKDGEMFFGGPDGFNSFYPNKIKYNKNLPRVAITELRIFNSPIKVNDKINGHVVLKNNIVETKKLKLTYKENSFAFEFVALDYTSPEKNLYAYKMEGFDNDWIYCGTKREANYTNLDAGEYLFRVKACNNDGYWNEEGTSIKLIITPPWWKTIWFTVFSILFISLIVLGAFRYRLNTIKAQKLELQKLVDQRTIELNHTNDELIENQLQLENKNEQLNETNKSKDKLFSIIAHDLKNPIGVILGFSSLLIDPSFKFSDTEYAELTKGIHDSTQRIFNLLENLLMWSRSQLGHIKITPSLFNLTNQIYEVINLLEGYATVKNIKLVFDGNIEIIVFADMQMIDTVLRNLISNAIKFSKENEEVKIELIENDDKAICSISDEGVGMTQDQIATIFEIDKVKSTMGTMGEKGTGLGLNLCLDFLNKNNGKIWVKSQPNGGSTFYFSLPISKGNNNV
ncbi:MAG TPA: two-component regulator propeller domain-containing protein [Prolixibacteraceae bacterium]|nr:two-component regulator propeller domain-containing protein [Prolixibacteraceae bacterium]